MIIATAGHIDHGKTLLIRALTGIDTDRLPEEKRREMTIDLGFAYLPLQADQSIAFIDVPGHERFIRNMLCGVAAIDLVLFVVAADDGIMPQTREHLAILDLLGVQHGAVALTKIDRVEAERIETVTAEIENLLAPTTLAAAPVFPVSAATGSGVATLQEHIVQIGTTWRPSAPAGAFRLAVDRCFHVVGAGVVATGTAFAGEASVGDELVLQSTGQTLRVRGIHANNTPAQHCCAGQRCALNLAGAGVTKQAVKRGDWIIGQPSDAVRRIDTRFRVLPSERRGFRHWTPVHVHLGAAETTGRVAILDGKEIEPGNDGFVQLYLDQPIGACYGDRFIVRDQSAKRTVGGGHVIDVFPPARGRAKPERLAALVAMDEADPAIALSQLLDATPGGIDLGRFRQARNLTESEIQDVSSRVEPKTVSLRSGARAFSALHWQRLRERALSNLTGWHVKSPTSPGLPERQLLSGLGLRAPAEASLAIARELAREGVVAKDGTLVRLPDHRGHLSSPDAVLTQRITTALEAAGRVPPTLHELAEKLESNVGKIEKLLVRMARRGGLARVGNNRFFTKAGLRELAGVAEALAAEAESGRFGVKEYRDRAGIGRNLTIEVLEHFDDMGLTHRVGDGRELRRPLAEIFGSEEDSTTETTDVSGKESHPGGAPGLQIR